MATKAEVNKQKKITTKKAANKKETPSSKGKLAHSELNAAKETLGISPYSLSDNEEYMNSDQQTHFKSLLEAWRLNLSKKINEAVSHLKTDPKHFADLNDRATQEEEFNLELRARDREADLMVTIDDALKRLHDGDYGYCDECGVEIGIRRLEARPTATECIDCKTLSEIRERQVGGYQ
ncbi:MAG: RNA polymerase-binding protein DksA [Gammaproteobacteria bacterium]|nr:RNA polymerase-binding protein DksA [Gammaproteobacteria bacterium]MCD8542973.1 RNA polymerase-binding protein DksA [Gammaproteobacteria bacterium]